VVIAGEPDDGGRGFIMYFLRLIIVAYGLRYTRTNIAGVLLSGLPGPYIRVLLLFLTKQCLYRVPIGRQAESDPLALKL
jgi:hypothetical protein